MAVDLELPTKMIKVVQAVTHPKKMAPEQVPLKLTRVGQSRSRWISRYSLRLKTTMTTTVKTRVQQAKCPGWEMCRVGLLILISFFKKGQSKAICNLDNHDTTVFYHLLLRGHSIIT